MSQQKPNRKMSNEESHEKRIENECIKNDLKDEYCHWTSCTEKCSIFKLLAKYLQQN